MAFQDSGFETTFETKPYEVTLKRKRPHTEVGDEDDPKYTIQKQGQNLYYLLDLPFEMVVAVAGHVAKDAALPLACTSKGCLEAVKTAHPGEMRTAIRSVCTSIRLVEWACQPSGPLPWDDKIVNGAVAAGSTGVLAFLYFLGIRCVEQSYNIAEKYGPIEVFEWLRNNGFPWDEDTCDKAAKHGHLDLLIWAHKSDCWWDWDTCTEAAENGHLDCLKYAHENGCEWNELTCAGAARCGQAGSPAAAAATSASPAASPRSWGRWR